MRRATDLNDEDWQLRQLGVMAQAKNYNRFIFERVIGHVGRVILEVGSGLGQLAGSIMETKPVSMILVDRSIRTGSYLRDKYNGRAEIVVADIFDAALHEKLRGKNIDTVICCNLLEHVDDDSRLLSIFGETLVDHGKLILLVPAFQSIYGAIDARAGHVRRYRKEDLAKKARSCGFSVIESKYVNFIGFFSWYVNGRLLGRENVSAMLLGVYDRLAVPLTGFLENRITMPFGQSLFCVLSKKPQKEA